MVELIRTAEEALGEVSYEITEKQKASSVFRRSLFVVKDMTKGEGFTEQNVRSIRPGNGLQTKYLEFVLGKGKRRDIRKDSTLIWKLFL